MRQEGVRLVRSASVAGLTAGYRLPRRCPRSQPRPVGALPSRSIAGRAVSFLPACCPDHPPVGFTPYCRSHQAVLACRVLTIVERRRRGTLAREGSVRRHSLMCPHPPTAMGAVASGLLGVATGRHVAPAAPAGLRGVQVDPAAPRSGADPQPAQRNLLQEAYRAQGESVRKVVESRRLHGDGCRDVLADWTQRGVPSCRPPAVLEKCQHLRRRRLPGDGGSEQLPQGLP